MRTRISMLAVLGIALTLAACCGDVDPQEALNQASAAEDVAESARAQAAEALEKAEELENQVLNLESEVEDLKSELERLRYSSSY